MSENEVINMRTAAQTLFSALESGFPPPVNPELNYETFQVDSRTWNVQYLGAMCFCFCLMVFPLHFSFLVITSSPWTLFADFRLITWFWPLSVFDLWVCFSSIKSLNQSWSVYRDWWHEKVNPSPPLVAITPNLQMVWKDSALQAWTRFLSNETGNVWLNAA